MIIPDIGHDKPLVLFRIDVGAVAPAGAHSAYIDIQQDSAVLILAVLRVQQVIRIDPEIPWLILRLYGEYILTLAQHPPAVKLNGGIQCRAGRVDARPYRIGGVRLPVIPAADQHFALLDAHNPDLVGSAGFGQLAHRDIPNVHGDVVHRLSKIPGADREEHAARFHCQLARKHLCRDIGHMDADFPVEIGMGYADAVLALLNVQFQRRVQLFHILIIEAECQASGFAGGKVHQKMALHVRLFGDVAGHHAQRLFRLADLDRFCIVIVYQTVDRAGDRRYLIDKAGDILITLALRRSQCGIGSHPGYGELSVITKDDLRNTGNLRAVGVPVLKAQHVHQVVGRVADHVHCKGHIPDLSQCGQYLPAHVLNHVVLHGLKKGIGAEVIRQPVIFLFMKIDGFLSGDIHDRHACIPRFVIIEPAAIEAMLCINGIHWVLSVGSEDDFTSPVGEHITATGLGHP